MLTWPGRPMARQLPRSPIGLHTHRLTRQSAAYFWHEAMALASARARDVPHPVPRIVSS